MNKIKKGKYVSAIVPVFNEEKTVKKVIEALLKSNLITEVISINDGSTDKSLEVLKSFSGKIKLINLKSNHGKGFALALGIKRAESEIVVFFDSDLINLSDKHIKTLLNYIFEGEYRAILGFPKRGSSNPKILVHLTGQRAYRRKDLLPYLEKMKKTRYGVETFLNSLFNKKETKVIPLEGLIHLVKYEKLDFSRAFKEYVIEAVEIAKEMGKKEIISPRDYQKIVDLTSVENFYDLKQKISKIKNKTMKKFLNKYVTKYLTSAKRIFRNFI
jgi:hypothetical protein